MVAATRKQVWQHRAEQRVQDDGCWQVSDHRRSDCRGAHAKCAANFCIAAISVFLRSFNHWTTICIKGISEGAQ